MSSSSNVKYIDQRELPPHQRGLGDALYETAEQILKLIETRFALLQAEMKEKVAAMKASAPMLVIGALVAIASFFVLTSALVALIAHAFAGSPWAIFLSCVIVGVLYAIAGSVMLLAGFRSVREKNLVPERTIHVLKEDRTWLENEAKTHL